MHHERTGSHLCFWRGYATVKANMFKAPTQPPVPPKAPEEAPPAEANAGVEETTKPASDLPELPKAPEEPQEVKPVDEPAAASEPAVAAEPEPAKVDEPAAAAVPVAPVVNGADLQPEERPAQQEKAEPATSAPEPTDAADAPVEGGASAEVAANGAPPVTESAAPSGAPEETVKASIPEPEDANGKRKADEAAPANGDVVEKKPKTESTVVAATNGHAPEIKKAPRSKKEKKEPAPVGKTARRTRSQGMLEA
jgi:hypothetical protein